MKGGSVRNNTALPYEGAGGMGGGIYICSESPVSLEGGDITGNAAGYGGGVYIDKSPVTGGGGGVTMTGGTVTGNRAEGYGGGILAGKGAAFTQTGGTVSGNKAPRSPDMHRGGEE
jgi:hypothetical protein